MSLASHAYNRLCELYGHVLRRMRTRNARLFQPDRVVPGPPMLERLEPRIMLDGTPGLEPVILIPGFGGTMPAFPEAVPEWLKNPGIAPGYLQTDPLANTYDNLISTFKNVGYVEDGTLFVANWDWRTPVAPQDQTPDGYLENVSGQGITDTVYETGLDYLGYWLKQAAEAWAEDPENGPLESVDLITHSTGGLIARSYIQSAAYGARYDSNGDGTVDSNDQSLPLVDDLVLAGVPNQGAGDVWTILHNDFNSSVATRGLGVVTHAAWDLAEDGATIYNPDGTEMLITDEDAFVRQYIGAANDLVPTFDFVDTNLDGHLEPVGADFENTLLLDLNAISDPNAF